METAVLGGCSPVVAGWGLGRVRSLAFPGWGALRWTRGEGETRRGRRVHNGAPRRAEARANG
ncbi:MAG: hypothetical protein ACOX9C_09490, partial [Kiritimatiellia bacterium]